MVHYYSFLSPINKLHLHLFACTQTSFPQKHLHITHRLKGTRLKYICTYIFTVYKSIQNLCCMVQEHFRASIDVHNQNCFIIAHYMGFVKHPAYTHLLFFLTVTTRESSSILCSTIDQIHQSNPPSIGLHVACCCCTMLVMIHQNSH